MGPTCAPKRKFNKIISHFSLISTKYVTDRTTITLLYDLPGGDFVRMGEDLELREIVRMQPYLSTYYEATENVIKKLNLMSRYYVPQFEANRDVQEIL